MAEAVGAVKERKAQRFIAFKIRLECAQKLLGRTVFEGFPQTQQAVAAGAEADE